ncbi:MAG: hypothetical protein NVSMB39_6400 [Candidatus Saccharimonadales bacterium]
MMQTKMTLSKALPGEQPYVVSCVRYDSRTKIAVTFDSDLILTIDPIRNRRGEVTGLRELTLIKGSQDQEAAVELAHYITKRSFFSRRGSFTTLEIPQGFLGELLLVLLQDFLYWDYSHSVSRDIIYKYRVANAARDLAEVLFPRVII